MTRIAKTICTPFTTVPLRVFGRVLLFLLLAGNASAQTTTSSTDGSTPLALAPGAPAGSYALSGFDNINHYSGHLNFRLPLDQVVGRGDAQMTMMLPIEQQWIVRHRVTPTSESFIPTWTWWHIGPGYGPGVLQGRQVGSIPNPCPPPWSGLSFYSYTLTRLTFTAPDGTEYELRDQPTGGKPLSTTGPLCLATATRGPVFITADGMAATFISKTFSSPTDVEGTPVTIDERNYGTSFPLVLPTGHLMLRDGTRYRIESGYVTSMRDRNGNMLNFTYENTSSSRVLSITDSLNRVVNIAYADTTNRAYAVQILL